MERSPSQVAVSINSLSVLPQSNLKAEDISTMIKRRTREQKFHFFQSRPMASLPKKKIQKKFAFSGGGNGVLNIFPKFLRDFVLRNFVRFFSHCSIFHAK